MVSQDRHCLARLGTAKVKQDFQACIKPSQNGEPGHRCEAFCHIDPKERYGLPVAPNLEYLAIRTRVEENLQNPLVFSRPLLAVSSMPNDLLSGGIVGRLLEIRAAPRVARLLLEVFPDSPALRRMMGGGDEDEDEDFLEDVSQDLLNTCFNRREGNYVPPVVKV